MPCPLGFPCAPERRAALLLLLECESLFAAEYSLSVFNAPVAKSDSGNSVAQTDCLFGGTHVDVTTRSVTASTTDVDLVVKLGKEYVSVCLGTASAYQARATSSLGSDSKTLCRGLALNFVRRVDLYEVCAEAQSNTSCASNQIGILFVGNSLAGGRSTAQQEDQQHEPLR